MKYKSGFQKYETMYGPHFNEEYAVMAVSNMVNEDGTKGAHWTLEQTTAVALQHGVNLNTGKYNKYDWYVAMNMLYSDFYKSVISMTNSDNVKHYVCLAKAWLDDKDVEEGKMWYYYKYVICDKFRDQYDMVEDETEEEEEYGYEYQPKHRTKRPTYFEDDYEDSRYMRRPTGYSRRYMSRHY